MAKAFIGPLQALNRKARATVSTGLRLPSARMRKGKMNER